MSPDWPTLDRARSLGLAAQDLVERGDRDLDLRASGSCVVIFCSQMPGAISACITIESGNRAPSRSTSYASPAMSGIAITPRSRSATTMPGVPNSVNTKIVMTITMIRKFVPHGRAPSGSGRRRSASSCSSCS